MALRFSLGQPVHHPGDNARFTRVVHDTRAARSLPPGVSRSFSRGRPRLQARVKFPGSPRRKHLGWFDDHDEKGAADAVRAALSPQAWAAAVVPVRKRRRHRNRHTPGQLVIWPWLAVG